MPGLKALSLFLRVGTLAHTNRYNTAAEAPNLPYERGFLLGLSRANSYHTIKTEDLILANIL